MLKKGGRKWEERGDVSFSPLGEGRPYETQSVSRSFPIGKTSSAEWRLGEFFALKKLLPPLTRSPSLTEGGKKVRLCTGAAGPSPKGRLRHCVHSRPYRLCGTFPHNNYFSFKKKLDKTAWTCYNILRFAAMAQSVEHIIGNDEVTSSILVSSSKKHLHVASAFFAFNICRKQSGKFMRFACLLSFLTLL